MTKHDRTARDPSAELPASAPAEKSLDAALATPLYDLDIPTRLTYWLDREKFSSLGELARLGPRRLAAARGVGLTSVRAARRLVERTTGRTWEELLVHFEPPPEPEPAPARSTPLSAAEIGALKKWEDLDRLLTEEQRAIPLRDLDLPGSLRTYVEREALRSVGELIRRPRSELLATPQVGPKKLEHFPRAIRDYLEAIEADQVFAGADLLASFRAAVERLEPRLRTVIERRSGLTGHPEPHGTIGRTFGRTKGRVHQLVGIGCTRLAREPWAREARRRVDATLEEGAAPLDELVRDEWWAAAVATPGLVEFVVGTVLRAGAHLIDLLGARWLSRVDASAAASAWQGLLLAAERVALPAPIATFETLVEAAARDLGQRAAACFLDALRAHLHLDRESGAERAVAFGQTHNAAILALLRASRAPVPVGHVARLLGRRYSDWPDEVLHLGRGYVGLRQHFPDFAGWQRKLAPHALRIVSDLGPSRQWVCGEILDELRKTHRIPKWLTAYGLAELIKAEGSLRYLGRLRVALPAAADNDARLMVHEVLERLLRDAGGPVPRALLVEAASRRVGSAGTGFETTLARRRFVRVDEHHIGLLSRDVPGGAAAIARAGDHIANVLARRGRGLSEAAAHAEVVELSACHGTWTPWLLGSVLRADGRFRFSRSNGVGLADWDADRGFGGRPTRSRR